MKYVKKIIFPIILITYALVFFVFITSRSGILSGIRSFVVVTGSMEPNVKVGTLVFTQPQSTYMKNDIIAFDQDGRTITHRVVDIKQQRNSKIYITKGDANNAADNKETLPGAVIGKNILAVPYVGSIVTTFKTIPGFIAFVVVPALIFIAFEFKNIKIEIEKETEKRLNAKNSTI